MTEQTQEAPAEEIVADATTTPTEEVSVDEVSGVVDEQEPGETPAWAEKRFKKLAAQKHDAMAKADQAVKEAEYWKNLNQEQKPAEVVATAKPTREQFDFDDEQYIDALTDWKIDQKEQEQTQARTAKQNEEAKFEHIKSFESRREATVNAGREAYDDFDDVVFSLPPTVMNESMAAAIFESDNPAEISYYLGKHPDVAEKISTLSPMKKAIELGKIAGVQKATKRQSTTAPPPIKPVGTGGSIDKNPANMSSSEYRKYSREQRLKHG